MITKIKKWLFKYYYNKKMTSYNSKKIQKLYDLYDYVDFENELKIISKEYRKKLVDDMLTNNIDEFIYNFGDFKTANMWINEPWGL